LTAREILNAGAAKDMTEALAMAGPAAQDTLKWISELAMKSPFDETGVSAAYRTALTYGFTSDEAKKLTENTLDLLAATGQESTVMNSVALALGQINSKGRVTADNLNQLAYAGVPVNDILKGMGFTLDDVSKGLVDADSFMEAFNKTLEGTVGGSAERMANSWSGILSTLDELKKKGLRTLFKGMFDELQPLVAKFTGWLSGDGMAKLENMGKWLGNATKGLLDFAGGLKGKSFVDLTQMFEDWMDGVDWSGMSQGIADKIATMDWAAIGLEIRAGFINIFNGLSTMVSEINWGALASSLSYAGKNLLAGLLGYDSWQTVVENMQIGWAYLKSEFMKAITGIYPALREKGQELTGQIAYGIEQKKKLATDAMYDLAVKIKAAIDNKIQEMKDAGATIVNNIIASISSRISAIQAKAREIVQRFKDAFTSAANSLSNLGKLIGDKILSGFQSAINTIYGLITNIINTLRAEILDLVVDISSLFPGGTGTTSGSTGGGSTTGGSPPSGTTGIVGHAKGGIATGSNRGHWELLHGTEGIFTRDQMAMLAPVGSSGGVTINLTYAPAVSLASEAELRAHLLPVILEGVKTAQRYS
jgi:tape measure domain-containing protein